VNGDPQGNIPVNDSIQNQLSVDSPTAEITSTKASISWSNGFSIVPETANYQELYSKVFDVVSSRYKLINKSSDEVANEFATKFFSSMIILSRQFPIDFGVAEDRSRILTQVIEVIDIHRGDWVRIVDEIGPGLMAVPLVYCLLLHLVDANKRHVVNLFVLDLRSNKVPMSSFLLSSIFILF
jgi:hypothetical protein